MEKLQKAGLDFIDLVSEEGIWSKKVLANSGEGLFSIEAEGQDILKALEKMAEKAKDVDKSLEQVFAGEAKRMEKSLEGLEKRVQKAQKRKEEEQINQIRSIINRVYPNGGLQERSENFSQLYLKLGRGMFDLIYDSIDVFKASMNVITY